MRHPLALPFILLAIPAAFYGVLAAAGCSLADAQAAGWVPQPQEGPPAQFWHAWRLYDLGQFPGNIAWDLVAGQAGKLMALFFVVAFGSSMDVAAISQSHPEPLDYNSELVTVGGWAHRSFLWYRTSEL